MKPPSAAATATAAHAALRCVCGSGLAHARCAGVSVTGLIAGGCGIGAVKICCGLGLACLPACAILCYSRIADALLCASAALQCLRSLRYRSSCFPEWQPHRRPRLCAHRRLIGLAFLQIDALALPRTVVSGPAPWRSVHWSKPEAP